MRTTVFTDMKTFKEWRDVYLALYSPLSLRATGKIVNGKLQITVRSW